MALFPILHPRLRRRHMPRITWHWLHWRWGSARVINRVEVDRVVTSGRGCHASIVGVVQESYRTLSFGPGTINGRLRRHV